MGLALGPVLGLVLGLVPAAVLGGGARGARVDPPCVDGYDVAAPSTGGISLPQHVVLSSSSPSTRTAALDIANRGAQTVQLWIESSTDSVVVDGQASRTVEPGEVVVLEVKARDPKARGVVGSLVIEHRALGDDQARSHREIVPLVSS